MSRFRGYVGLTNAIRDGISTQNTSSSLLGRHYRSAAGDIYDVVVVGGGLVGSAVAAALSKCRSILSVVVLHCYKCIGGIRAAYSTTSGLRRLQQVD